MKIILKIVNLALKQFEIRNLFALNHSPQKVNPLKIIEIMRLKLKSKNVKKPKLTIDLENNVKEVGVVVDFKIEI